ncbi:MAG: hypothetical protein GEU80_03730 [Dehalococcoidia bacterium]|nr:hypothetical protein [Dehalococcoidia bacterium]
MQLGGSPNRNLSPLVALVLVVLAALALAACDDNGTPAPSATPMSATATRHPPAVIGTFPPTPTLPPLDEQQVAIIDATTGDLVELLDAPTGLVLATGLYPRFTRDGTGVWLAFRDDGLSRRYGLDGRATEELPGAWGVTEAEGGRYYYRATAGALTTTLVVKVGGREVEADLPTTGILSPDFGRVAYTEHDAATELNRLVVEDVETGEQRVLDERVAPCHCDGGPAPHWSPSGRHLAYVDFPYGKEDEPSGIFVVDVETGDAVQLSEDPWGLGAATWESDKVARGYEDGALLFIDAATGELVRRLDVGGRPRIVAGLEGDTVVALEAVTERPFTYATHAYRLHDGMVLGSWRGAASIEPTTAGLAVAIPPDPPPAGDLACEGVLVEHPSLTQERCIEGGRTASWSPGGRFLAVASFPDGASESQVAILDFERDGAEVATYTAEPYPWLEWNQQGTHLLIARGFGL